MRLSEQEIATRMGLSRQPVREALIALAKSKLVETRPNRGTVVVHISARQMMEANDHNAFRREDEQAHIAIAEGAGCGLAWNAISDIKAHMDRVCNLQLRHPGSMTRLIAEHEAIIAAIGTRDAEAAETAMRTHLNGILTDLPLTEAANPDLFA